MESRTVQVDGALLHVAVVGTGTDVLFLSGGPGCVQYLEDQNLQPTTFRAWFPEPRGVGRSSGGPHSMEQAIADLEAIREAVDVARWTVIGHSWGCELAVRYAVEHPDTVTAVTGIAGTGPQRDRSWSSAYEAARDKEPDLQIEWVPAVHTALMASFSDWIHSPTLWRSLADCPVPMHFVAAGDDIRPPWPLAQLAALVPHGRFTLLPGVAHDFWRTHPEIWNETVARDVAAVTAASPAAARP